MVLMTMENHQLFKMKKLFLLLFIVPVISFSQITYKDVMSINSEKMFKKVMIENGYELSSVSKKNFLVYGYAIQKDSIEGDKSTKWGYYVKNGEFILSFSRNSVLASVFKLEEDNSENEYDLIVKEIKKKCKYYDIISRDYGNGIKDYVCYSCVDSKYKGKIGFMVSEGEGIIQHFVFDGSE